MGLLNECCIDGLGGGKNTIPDAMCAEGIKNESRLYLHLIKELEGEIVKLLHI